MSKLKKQKTDKKKMAVGENTESVPKSLQVPPAWCKVRIQVDEDGFYVHHGKEEYDVGLPKPPSYETAVMQVPLHAECENWVGQEVLYYIRLGRSGAIGVVRSSHFPLKMWKAANEDSNVDIGHLRLTGIELVAGEPATKFKRNMLLSLDGKTSFETVQKLLDAGQTKAYAMSSILGRTSNRKRKKVTKKLSDPTSTESRVIHKTVISSIFVNMLLAAC